MPKPLTKALIATILSALLVASLPFQASAKIITKRIPPPKADKQPKDENLLHIKKATLHEDSFVVDGILPDASHKIMTCGYYVEPISDDNFTLRRDQRIDRFVDITNRGGDIVQLTVGDSLITVMPITSNKESYRAFVIKKGQKPIARECKINSEGLLNNCKKVNGDQPPLDGLWIEMENLTSICDLLFEKFVKGKASHQGIEPYDGPARQLRLKTDRANLETLTK